MSYIANKCFASNTIKQRLKNSTSTSVNKTWRNNQTEALQTETILYYYVEKEGKQQKQVLSKYASGLKSTYAHGQISNGKTIFSTTNLTASQSLTGHIEQLLI